MLPCLRQLRGARHQPIRHARRHIEQASQLVERLRGIVDADVDDAFDGGVGFRIERPDDEDAGGLHAARIAALRLAGVERVHQALGHRALAAAIGGRHGLDDGGTGERVALRGEVFAGDVAGVTAKMNEILRIGIAIDDALAGVDGRAAFGVDHGDLARVAAGILVGDAFDHFGRRQPLLEQRDRLGTVLPIRRRLRGDGADTRLGVRNRGARPKRARLDTDTKFVGRRIERDDREGAEPGIRNVRLRPYARARPERIGWWWPAGRRRSTCFMARTV